MAKLYYTWEEYEKDIKDIISSFKKHNIKFKAIYAVPKGGLVLGVSLANKLNIPLYSKLEDAPKKIKRKDLLIVDDVSDSGLTLLGIPGIASYSTLTLFYKPQTAFLPNYVIRECENEKWIVYPWE